MYVFSTIQCSGSSNNFVSILIILLPGNFYIYVHGNVDLGKSNASMTNGGSASMHLFRNTWNRIRLFYQQCCMADCQRFFRVVPNGWVPFICSRAAINIGSGTGNTVIGALYSATQVAVQCGVTITYAPFITCLQLQMPMKSRQNINLVQLLHCKLSGSSTTSNDLCLVCIGRWKYFFRRDNSNSHSDQCRDIYNDSNYSIRWMPATDIAVVSSNMTAPQRMAGQDVAFCAGR